MNVLSALYPALPSRLELLRDVLPLHVIRASQTATVLAGFFLILLADGLRKRRTRAMQVTVALLVASCLLNLAKGLDFEEASVALWLAGGLVLSRREFMVRSPFPVGRGSIQPALSFALLYFGYLFAGFLTLRHAIHPTPSIGGVLVEPFRLLFGWSPYVYAGPQAEWFQRSVTLTGAVAVVFAIISVLRPHLPSRDSSPHELARVRALVDEYGADTLAYFALQDGRRYFFDQSGEAVLSYRIQGSVALVAGDPIGKHGRMRDLVTEFLAFAESYGLEPCFLGTTSRLLDLYGELGMQSLKIGEEALIDLPRFDLACLKRKVRRALRHVEDEGISVQSFQADSIPPDIAEQMQEIWREWVEAKGGSERGFSMTLGRLPRPSDRGCEAVIASQGDQVMGYVCLVPAHNGRGWSLDAMRRRPGSPNGLMEAIIIRAAEIYRDRGYEVMSLNFATLSNTTREIDSRMVEATRRFLFDNMSGLYQLKSLYQFNSKFEPSWHSRYVVFRGVRKMPKLALAIVQSEDPIRLPLLGPIGIRIER